MIFLFTISLLLDPCTFMSKGYSWWHIKLINHLNLVLRLRIHGVSLHFPMLFEDMDISTGTAAATFTSTFTVVKNVTYKIFHAVRMLVKMLVVT